ncbi:MAG: hypothetical protein JSS72_08085 [Armatimonadetes bacterium]|nr:hypothetical protein [Armatimonadota bacterium]
MIATIPLMIALLSPAQNTQSVLLRLNPGDGARFQYRLRVERLSEHRSGDLYFDCSVRQESPDDIMVTATISKLVVNGKDRTAELRANSRNLTGSLGWNSLSARSGGETGMSIDPAMGPQLMDIVREAGLYFGFFLPGKVHVGSEWQGMTTASGGCTSGRYKLAGFSADGRRVRLQVNNIRMYNGTQVGPMEMVVDLAHGVPTSVSYQFREHGSNKLSRITQTMTSSKWR